MICSCSRILVEDAVATIARQASEHIVLAHVEELVTIIGDAERLLQVVRNLLENAITHTPRGTVIEAVLRRSDGVAQITVRDTGPGIPEEHLPYLWDRFYRIDKARSRAADGSGLGLSIVKYIVEAHGGTVSVASAPGTGTTFTVVVPLVRADEQARLALP
jgi:signal transduction histidine kinase